MRTIQEIFNAVIDNGYYEDSEVKQFMCISLNAACKAGVITYEECYEATDLINDYIGEWFFLEFALFNNGLPYDFESRLAIYRDWASRPVLGSR